MKRVLAILAATIWISLSEFVRNEFIVKAHWVDHYKSMGLDFPSAPINGAVWGVWSLVFAGIMYILSRRFTFLHTAILSWVIGFVLMWLVIGNLGVLPWSILPLAIPLSMVEAFVAAWLIRKVDPV
jgi:drug/metabolite transporter (DMT)-like permease